MAQISLQIVCTKGISPNSGNASNVAQFNQGVKLLFDQLRNDASKGGSLRKYATYNTSGPGFTTLYGLMQCTPDLSEIDCSICLDRAISYIPSCCDSKRGARFYFSSCNMRYEEYRFYSDAVTLELPSPPPPPKQPSPPAPSPSGESSNTTIIVVAVVASIVIVAMAAKFEIEKFNENNFALWKLKMKAIVRKDKCLAAIGERPTEVTDDKEKKSANEIWDHLARLYEARSLHDKKVLRRKLYALRMTESTSVTEHVNSLNTLFSQLTSLSCKIDSQEVFNDVVAAILEEENKRNNREDMQTSSRQAKALVVTKGSLVEDTDGDVDGKAGGDSTTRESTSIQIKKEFQSNDSFEAAPQYEMNGTNESQAPATRTLNRERRRPGWHSDYVMESNVAYCLFTEDGEPSTLQEALNNPEASVWKEAMQEEIKALHKNKTYRARLVVKGYAQKEGVDFNEIFSPVVRMTRIRVLLAMCATYDLHLEQLNVKTAFLYRNLKEEIYMLQPEGFKQKRREYLKSYVKKILQRFNMQDCKPISTLFPTNVKLFFKMSPSSEKERMKMSRVPYASAVESLIFAMICTRLDIAHAMVVVSWYTTEPGREHWEAMNWIHRYIKRTQDVALCYGESGLTVKGYVDSDYAGDLDRSKSTTGYAFTLSGGTVSWASKLQSVVAMSTMEA
nr:Gag-Pol polyprotein [Tanacetum cinerariifolium]